MYDVIIIGAGIAGCTAAIYAARKNMHFELLSKNFGGQLMESGEIYNYPGIKHTNGFAFSDALEEQLNFNNVKPKIGIEVTQIQKEGKAFRVFSDSENFLTKAVLITTGSHPKKLNVPGEERLTNKGLTYCAICDGPLFKNKEIAIIGGGNSALEGLDFSKNIAERIFLINNATSFNAHEYLIEKVRSLSNVEIYHQSQVLEVSGDKHVEGIKFRHKDTPKYLNVQGVIVEIGRTPATGFVENFVELNKKKYIVIDCQTQTSVKGVFAAGDCASGEEYQYVIAAGQGCIGLIKAARYITHVDFSDEFSN